MVCWFAIDWGLGARGCEVRLSVACCCRVPRALLGFLLFWAGLAAMVLAGVQALACVVSVVCGSGGAAEADADAGVLPSWCPA